MGSGRAEASEAWDRVATVDAVEARRARREAANRYKPEPVDLLIVAEAPPSALDRYFYFEDVKDRDSLFRYIARGALGAEPTRGNKVELLSRLKERGVFLIDLSPDPVDGTPLAEGVRELIERCRVLAPGAIILVKATVYDAAYWPMKRAGLPVVDERIPFPGSGHQKRFEAAFSRALRAVNNG
jgi:hypothetical protein